jgi:hypothetical protein
MMEMPLTQTEGAGKAGCSKRTRGLASERTKDTSAVTTGSLDTIRLFLREWFTAYFVLSLVIGLSCHHRQRINPPT